MKSSVRLPFADQVIHLRPKDWDFIQVVLGPRQVGKTTGVQQFLQTLPPGDWAYASADGPMARHSSWIEEQWILLQTRNPNGLLVIDEIQKVENWSEVLKKLWDHQKRQKDRLRVLVLGSSSLGIQRGLSESLTGRFFLHKVFQWNAAESAEAYGLGLEDFLRFGGYPGSYAFLEEPTRWLAYVNESIVETVIGKDILQLARVKSPALFRQCFDLACSYGGQEISYTKLLGQLQERGNVDLVKHYLELFEGAFLLKQLGKYSAKKVLSRASSPKILPLCPALFSLTKDADFDEDDRARAFEIAMGCELCRLPGEVFYWREGNHEVDYVYCFGKRVVGIEVKSGRVKSLRGLSVFREKHPKAEVMIFTPENFREGLENLK